MSLDKAVVYQERPKGRPCKGTPKLTEEERKEAKRLTNERYNNKNREKINLYRVQKYNENIELSRIKGLEYSERYVKEHYEDVRLYQISNYYKKKLDI
jgi:hypothetical protein